MGKLLAAALWPAGLIRPSLCVQRVSCVHRSSAITNNSISPSDEYSIGNRSSFLLPSLLFFSLLPSLKLSYLIPRSHLTRWRKRAWFIDRTGRWLRSEKEEKVRSLSLSLPRRGSKGICAAAAAAAAAPSDDGRWNGVLDLWTICNDHRIPPGGRKEDSLDDLYIMRIMSVRLTGHDGIQIFRLHHQKNEEGKKRWNRLQTSWRLVGYTPSIDRSTHQAFWWNL